MQPTEDIHDPSAPLLLINSGAAPSSSQASQQFTRVRQVPCLRTHADLSGTVLEVAFKDRILKLRSHQNDGPRILDKWEAAFLQHLEYYNDPQVRQMVEDKRLRLTPRA